MILRVWSGWPAPGRAAEYDHLLDESIAPGIVDRRVHGLRRFEVWRRVGDEVGDRDEVLTAMWFDDMAAVGRFTGGDPHRSVVPPEARRVLESYDEHSRHYRLERRHL